MGIKRRFSKEKKIMLCTSFLLFLLSCLETDCDALKKIMSDEECNIVLTKPIEDWSYFRVIGYDPLTKKTKECKTGNRWWELYKNEMEIGDTLVKKKGELALYIHKKDTIFIHEWVCYDENGNRHNYLKHKQ